MKVAAAVATAAAVALLVGLVGVAQASPPTPASGTIIQEVPTGFDIRFAGPNIIITQSTQGSVTGTLSGTFEDSITVVIHPNGRFNAHGTLTCECTVDGKEGVLEFVSTNTGKEVNGVSTFEGRYVIKGGTGELSGLRGVLEFEGEVGPMGLSTIDYSGQIHFHP